MSFPTDPLDTRVELELDGHWTDITSEVQQRDDITITGGKSGESSSTAPMQMTLTLNNRNGNFSPKNPMGDYYEKIGSNTPIRVRTNQDSGATNFIENSTFETNVTGWQAFGFGYGGGSVAQSAVQAWQGTKSALVTWPTFSGGSFIGTFSEDLVNGRTYTLSFYAYVPAGNPDVRATLGFLASSAFMTTKNAWTRISLTFVADGAAPGVNYSVGVEAQNTTAGQICYIDGVMLEEGSSASTFTTTAPDFSTRCTLEVTSWPKKWDTSGNDAFVQIEATGRLSRDSQSDHPVSGGLKDFYMATTPIIYWPLDDGPASVKGLPAKRTTNYYSSFYETYANRVVTYFGSGFLAEYLSKVLRIDDTITTAGTGYLGGFCRGSDITPDSLAWEFTYRADSAVSGGTNMAALIMDFNITGSAVGTYDQWTLEFRPDGVNDDFNLILRMDVFSDTPTVVNIANSSLLAALTDGMLHHVRFQLTVSGADTNYAVYLDGVSVISGTRSSYTLREPVSITLAYDRHGNLGEDLVAFGHMIVWENLANIPSIDDSSNAVFGYASEAAGRRFERLAGVAGIPFVSIGDLDDTELMGFQFEDYYQNQIIEIENTDRGMIYEPRDSLANGYRTRKSLYSQTPAIVVDYSAHELQQPFEPVGDNNPVVNDVFAQRREGSSYQATLESGSLSVQEPPNGIGRVKKEYPVNTETDAQLQGVAYWLLHLGTVDEDRYPKLVIDRANLHVAANPTLDASLLTARMGDLISVENADAAYIFDDPQLLIVGFREVLNWKTHRFEWVCVPGSPYAVAEYGSGVGTGPDRYDTEGSALTVAIDTDDTALSVRSDETMWTTNDSEFPFPIFVGGEKMSLTDVTGGQPSFVGVGTSATGNNASVTPGLPASVASGDVVLIAASIRNSGTGNPNTPSNWTLVASNGNFRIFGRTYDGVWTMPTVTFTGGAAGEDTIGQSCAFRNVTLSGVTNAVQLNSSAQNIVMDSSSLNTDQQWGIIVLAGWKQDDWTSVATMLRASEIGEQVATAGNDAGQVWDYRLGREAGHDSEDFVVTGGASAISRGISIFLPRAPQNFTVQRSQNGVVKSHAVGAAVRLWKTPKYAM